MNERDDEQNTGSESHAVRDDLEMIRLRINQQDDEELFDSGLDIVQWPAGTTMFDYRKDITPTNGMPERWLKLLHKTHEVSSRIAQSIRKAIEDDDRRDAPTGRRDTGNDTSLGGYRAIGPIDE
jgi:hypothetical protein